jgi:mRNA-degrading endonuclease RelE of RelBE toxin-antitoxin system
MSYSIKLTDHLKKEAKRLQKKYPSIKTELKAPGNTLAENPATGIHLGNNIYKIRLAIKR